MYRQGKSQSLLRMRDAFLNGRRNFQRYPSLLLRSTQISLSSQKNGEEFSRSRVKLRDKNPQQRGEDAIVISGISGRFPESDNIEEFKQNLMNGVDMVTDQKRFKVGNKIPPRYGFMKNMKKFDAQFFNIAPKMADVMDPALRKLMEVTFEAFIDAGVNPDTLKGTKTGVFVGTTGGEGMEYWLLKGGTNTVKGYYFLGNLGIMQANQLSYIYDIKGPSMIINTGCSASMIALETAVQSINSGKCDSAIVATSSVQLNSHHSYEMKFLNALAPDGKCKSFDKKGDGYARGEAVVAIYIQKKAHALRNYATIRHVKSNADGYKKEGVFFPSGQAQEVLLREMYEEAEIDPKTVAYVEAHGTGTPAGDPQELQAISNVFCEVQDVRTRTGGPLLIGSVKSNMGHGESAAGLCGIAKVLIGIQEGVIPPNLHFNEPITPLAHVFEKGLLKVVTEKTPLKAQFLGVSAFGFGGTNTHAILEPNYSATADTDRNSTINNKIPLILPFSGRTESQLKESLIGACAVAKDSSQLTGLVHQIFKKNISGNDYRGFGIVQPESDSSPSPPVKSSTDQKIEAGETKTEEFALAAEESEESKSPENSSHAIRVQKCNSKEDRPLWFVFPGMGSQWNEMGKSLRRIDAFEESYQKSKVTFKNVGVDLERILAPSNASIFEDIRHAFIGITTIQIALFDTFTSLGLQPQGLIGHSFGEILCSYADGCSTAEESLLSVDARGRAFIEAQTCVGGMAAVDLSWTQIQTRCPPEIFPICHNAPENVTVSGPLNLIKQFVQELQSEGIFAKEVNSGSHAAHTKYVEPASQLYLKYLNEIHGRGQNENDRDRNRNRERSKKWISSAFEESEWATPLAQISSPEYHVHNMTHPVLFHEALKHVPDNAVVIEIAPQGMFQSILKAALPQGCTLVAPMQQKVEDKLTHFLTSMGDVYNAGVNVDFASLYPKVSFPVSGQTPSLSPLVKWDHGANWTVPIVENMEKYIDGVMNIDLNDSNQAFLQGHKLDNRIVFPATGYLIFAWESLAAYLGRDHNEVPVTFENLSFERATFLSHDAPAQLRCSILPGTGQFEVHQGGLPVVRGRIFTPELDDHAEPIYKDLRDESSAQEFITTNDIYKELKLRGYNYTGAFRSVKRIALDGNWAEVNWSGNWITFLDCVLQSSLTGIMTRTTVVPIRLQSLTINPKEFFEYIASQKNEQSTTMNANPNASASTTTTTNANDNPPPNDTPTSTISIPEKSNSIPVPVSMHKVIRALQCPGIEIRSLAAAIAPRKKQDGILSLCEYTFSPYFQNTNTTTDNPQKSLDSVLTEFVGVILENSSKRKFKVNDIFHKSENSVTDSLFQIFSNQPTHDAQISLLSTTSEMEKIDPRVLGYGTVLSKEVIEEVVLDTTPMADIVFLDNLAHLGSVAEAAKPDAWIVLHAEGTKNEEPILYPDYLQHVSDKNLDISRVALLRKKLIQKSPAKIQALSIHPENMEWLENLKSLMGEAAKEIEAKQLLSENSRIYIYSQNDPTSGILGLVKCLRLEPGGDRIRCIWDPASKLNLDFESPGKILSEIIDKDLIMNIYKDGALGSYRHLPVIEAALHLPSLKVEHAHVSMRTVGDLSSFRWVESPLKYYSKQHDDDRGKKGVHNVHVASMNFLDVMLASGKLPLESHESQKKNINLNELSIGFEFSGTSNESGDRVMGVVSSNALASHVIVGAHSIMWKIPEKWTFEEAATLPSVYATVYYAMIYRASMRRGESVLIHSGTGGVGQAAIRICLDMDCKIFTTVGTPEKREYIKKLFPSLSDDQIGNSRDTTFEKQVLRWSDGKGVDMILNSLADDKLQASVRLLAVNGKFLEIGKFDIFRNTNIGMECFLKNIDFISVDFAQLLFGTREKIAVHKLMEDGIARGIVQPLERTVFQKDQVEDAFRYMAAGKHTGKVLVKVRSEAQVSDSATNISSNSAGEKPLFDAVPRCHFDPSKSYVIVGGLGGMGLEVANWLVDRGAKHLILTSRSGVTTGYQRLCLKKWAERGVQVDTPQIDFSSSASTEEFLRENGSKIGGIFNSGLVLKDAFIENQTAETFKAVSAPKIETTRNLDALSRVHCPHLDYFVVFSSIACGLGNIGQSNYGYANSVMEQICDLRKGDGLHGLAIQWGVIGDVGYVAEQMSSLSARNQGEDKSLFGLVPQRISSCIQTLDSLIGLSKAASKGSKVTTCFTSMLVADKLAESSAKKLGLTSAVARICGIQDPAKIDPATPLLELGIDSLSGIELKQLFERDYSLELTPKQIRGLKFGDLKLIEAGTFVPGDGSDVLQPGGSAYDSSMQDILKSMTEAVTETLVKLNTANVAGTGKGIPPVFMVHGADGFKTRFVPLAGKLNFDFYSFQLNSAIILGDKCETAESLALEYIKEMKKVQPVGPYNIAGYSTGSPIAFEIATQLENEFKDTVENLTILDGCISSEFVPKDVAMKSVFTQTLEMVKQVVQISEAEEKEISGKLTPEDTVLSREILLQFIDKKLLDLKMKDENIKNYFEKVIKFLIISGLHTPASKFSGKTQLLKAKTVSPVLYGVDEPTYWLQSYCHETVAIHTVDGDHYSFLYPQNVEQAASVLNSTLAKPIT